MAVALVGFVGALAINTYLDEKEPVEGGRTSDLTDLVRALEDERTDLEGQLGLLRERIAQIEANAAEEAGVEESFGREIEQVRVMAGLTPLRGPGVRVVLADAASVPPGQDPSACLIHDLDIALVVNALLAAGAEGVSVNGERLVATTAIRCAGNTVLVNGRRVGNPYLIEAVGDPQALEDALRSTPGVDALFDLFPSAYGLSTSIEQVESLELPAYGGVLRAEYAAAAEGVR